MWHLLFFPSKGSSNLFSPSPHRYANTRHPAVRYSAYVRQRPPLVLLCLLHLWDCRCAALGRAAEKQVFPRQEFCNVSTIRKKKKISIFFFLSPSPLPENPQQSYIGQGGPSSIVAESTTWPWLCAFCTKKATCQQVTEGVEWLFRVFLLRLKDKDVSGLDYLCLRKLRSLTLGI